MMSTVLGPSGREFLKISEVAHQLHLHHSTVWRLVRRGELRAVKIGGVYRIRKVDFDALLRNAEVTRDSVRSTAEVLVKPE